MSTTMLQLVVFLLFSLFPRLIPSTRFISNSSYGNSDMKCIETERNALLQFRKALKDPSGQLSSWFGEDCCTWRGVGCSKRTGNVVKLDLRSKVDCSLTPCLGGKVSPSLLGLKRLKYLDLSANDFQGNLIPEFIGSFKNLRYLNLSDSFFYGIVPPHLGNLSNLQYLDLSSYFAIYYSSWVQDLNWLSGLHSLKYLNLESISLKKATGWFHAVNRLPFLLELHLSNCKLQELPPFLPDLNFTSLLVLHLSNNQLRSSIPNRLLNISTLVDIDLSLNFLNDTIDNATLGNHCSLRFLDLSVNGGIHGDVRELLGEFSSCPNSNLEELNLSSNEFTGQLPDSLDRLKYLRSLQLKENSISGPIPSSIGRLLFLRELDLSYNKMNGSIPESLGRLTKLTKLQLYKNSWKGVMSENLLKGLTELKDFSISSSDGTFSLYPRHEWVPPFSLRSIELSDYPLGPKFPAWLHTQTELSTIVLKNVSISHTIPDWLWELSPQIEKLDLSQNQIVGILPTSLKFSYVVDLSFNCLEGSIPLWPNVMFLYLGNNSFSGSIPLNIGQRMSSLLALDLSGNSLNGTIPSSMGKLVNLVIIDLSKNMLTGKIPTNWKFLKNLESIDLSKNRLSGAFPSSVCSLASLDWLKLSGNNLSGDLSSLQNCTSLSTLDLGDNRISGNIPEWIGKSISSLSELHLRANMFSGNIPKQLCSLPNIHILDLAQNNLSGSIPPCLGNLSRLTSLTSYRQSPPSLRFFYTPEMDLFLKGRQMGYTLTLELVNIVDLSSNNLYGTIPEEITNLSTLGTLNLSRNQLTGQIPQKIGDLRNLETLDLSRNQLSGPIPLSMSSITSLSHLNLSYNNLSGPIPSTNQFQTFNDPSIYEGNPGLCGSPLATKCHKPNNGGTEDNDDKDEEENDDKLGFCLSIGLGFIVGFWAVCGSLVIKKSWRHAYFRFLNKAKDWLIVVVAISLVRLQRRYG